MKMGKSSQKCTICLAEFEKGELIKKLPCSHILHRDCFKQWFSVDHRCPVCRLDLIEHYSANWKTSKNAATSKLSLILIFYWVYANCNFPLPN